MVLGAVAVWIRATRAQDADLDPAAEVEDADCSARHRAGDAIAIDPETVEATEGN
jgi:hypothetical protein